MLLVAGAAFQHRFGVGIVDHEGDGEDLDLLRLHVVADGLGVLVHAEDEIEHPQYGPGDLSVLAVLVELQGVLTVGHQNGDLARLAVLVVIGCPFAQRPVRGQDVKPPDHACRDVGLRLVIAAAVDHHVVDRLL